MKFRYQPLPWNIVFGVGALQTLPEHMDDLGLRRALVLSTPEQTTQGQEVASLLGARCIGTFDQAIMHVPVTTVVAARELAQQVQADCTVAIGGGSTTGLGKVLALQAGLANIVIPTSYAGSEMTNIWGTTQDGKKTTGRDNQVVPTLTIYDPTLTLSLPPGFAAASGLNAMAQAAVNVASHEINPIVQNMAQEAVRRLVQALPRVLAQPDDIDARSEALYGACLAGSALGTGSTGLHHRLCHTLGGSFNTPHAETHTVLLPHTVAYNAPGARAGTEMLANALGVANAAVGLHELAKQLGAPTSLQEIGIQESDLDRAAAIAVEVVVSNPRPVTEQAVRALLDDAYFGKVPTSHD